MKQYLFCALLLCSTLGAKAQLRMDSTRINARSPIATFTDNTSPSFKSLLPPQPVSTNFYAQHLPFFCKQELKLQQAHIPLQVRVGSINDCNWLEQKPGYMYRP